MGDTNPKYLGPVVDGRYVCPKCGTPSTWTKEENDRRMEHRCHKCGEWYRTLSGAYWALECGWDTICPQCYIPVVVVNGRVECPECKCSEDLPEIALKEYRQSEASSGVAEQKVAVSDSMVREVLLDCKRYGDEIIATQSDFYQRLLPRLNIVLGPLSERDRQYIEFQKKLDDWRHLLGMTCFVARQYLEAMDKGDVARTSDMLSCLRSALALIEKSESGPLDAEAVAGMEFVERLLAERRACLGGNAKGKS